MDAIILAAGKGKRMRPLTLDRPKPLLDLQGKPILAWSLLSLRGIVDRALIVVSYRKRQIARFVASQRIFASVELVEQLPEALGTGHALACCQPYLRGDDFLVINGDDLYSRAGLRRLVQQEFGILATPRDDFHKFGVARSDSSGRFIGIDEKPAREKYQAPAPCSIGAYKLRREVFAYRIERSSRGEYEISDSLSLLARDQLVAIVETPFWLPIGDAAALAAAQHVDLSPVVD